MNVGTSEIIEFYDCMLPAMERYHSAPNARLDKAKDTLKKIMRSGHTALDIGCGTGITSKHMAIFGAKVTAVDIASKLIEYAKKHSYHENITYLTQDICEFTSGEKFDIISLVDVIEHIDPIKLFKLISNLTGLNAHDDTLVYLNMPDFNFARFMIENYPEKLQIIDEAYSIPYVLKLFSDCGFTPTYISIYGIDTGSQYNEYIFVKKESLNNHYRERLDKIYNH